jgi:hypothetical protein
LKLPDKSYKNTQITNFMKIRLAEADLFHEGEGAGGGTDMTKVNCERALKTGELITASVANPGSVLNTITNG